MGLEKHGKVNNDRIFILVLNNLEAYPSIHSPNCLSYVGLKGCWSLWKHITNNIFPIGPFINKQEKGMSSDGKTIGCMYQYN